jgi:uncharacterized protein involved in exopolysaccharide biosynthesis
MNPTNPMNSMNPSNPINASDAINSIDDEINLLDLFLVMVKRKRLIIGLVFLAGIGAVIISLLLPNIYRSEATILPREQEQSTSGALSAAFGGIGGMVAGQLGLGGAGSVQKLEVTLKSKYLAQRVVEKYDLMPILFPDDWDRMTKKWTVEKPPTLQDGIKKITDDLMTVSSDVKRGTLKISFEHQSPETAKSVVDYFLTQMSEIMREVVLRDAAENMRFLADQLDRTTDSLMRAKIYDMLAKEIEKDTFARAQKYYGFYVPDPPVVPDVDKKAKPKRALICILSVVVALFIAVFLAFFLEYLGRVKTDDPDRYRQLREGLKLRKGK